LQENKLELQGTLAMVQRKMRRRLLSVKLNDIAVEQLNPRLEVAGTGLALWQSELDFNA